MKIEKEYKTLSIITLFILWGLCLAAQAPSGYYDPAAGKTGTALQQALHDIIDGHTSVTYANLWTSFATTDRKADGTIWDMYSDNPSGTSAYTYTYSTDQCGNYSSESDCYNREHSFPKSWFGGEVIPMYTDLFHLYPTDGYVNGKRDNYPFGEVGTASWTSTNGSKLGTSSVTGYTGTVFEPIDEYKGDFARSYFYMATRYYGEDSAWPGSNMVTGSQPNSWALTMLLQWNEDDEVSAKEIVRNNAVYAIQGNRNPFIDNNDYVDLVWGSSSGTEDITYAGSINIWPNPAKESFKIKLPGYLSEYYIVTLTSISGIKLFTKEYSRETAIIDVTDIETGLYIITINTKSRTLKTKIIVLH